MLTKLFVWLLDLSPGIKAWIWKRWYEYLAGRSVVGWTFMNYGYEPAETTQLVLDPSDERDRTCIQLYDRVVSPVNLEGWAVAEVGCGRGGGCSFIARYKKPSTLTGVDYSAKAVDFCRKQHRQVAGLKFEVGSADALPFAAESLDAVFNVESSHCYPSMEKFLAEVMRVLRPGGWFLFADFRGKEEVDLLRRHLCESGLVVQEEELITLEITRALRRDSERKQQLIQHSFPAPLVRSFGEFAGLEGSQIYRAFTDGSMVYLRFAARKPTNF